MENPIKQFDRNRSGIYQIRNLVNGKVYIGSAKCMYIRYNNHYSQLTRGIHHSIKLQNSFNKHGIISFVFEVLEECSLEALIIREQYYIDSLKPVYNIAPIAGTSRGRGWSEESKKAFSEKKKGAPAFIGAQWTQERKDKISASNKGRIVSEETKAKKSRDTKGRIFSLEHRAALSAAAFKRKYPKP